MKLLLDTNVLVDYFGARQPFFDQWELINALQITGYAELWASAESYTDAFYLLRKAVGPAKLQDMFLQSLSFIKVCSVDEGDIREAAERSWPDFEDCLIGICAEKVKADYIITRDADGFKRSSMPAMDAPSFFAMLEEEYGIVYDMVDW
ncbi:PIN domain-containing protein [Eggerthella timonensis]|uniref:PIN domain-containing protein n=1 Tax=Eggerthella timonensis TaxID=1871008 RepID=UPI000C755F0C|nr:PIN domain-containing protein [Eggerthella timonensis]